VIQRKDGSYEVIESSQSGLRRLEREGDLETKVDPSEAPDHLRCAFSGQLLKEAVELPCCKKVYYFIYILLVFMFIVIV
jgi:hypothetical protein